MKMRIADLRVRELLQQEDSDLPLEEMKQTRIDRMNLSLTSSGGLAWEAGVVSMEEKVVESVVDSILRLVDHSDRSRLN